MPTFSRVKTLEKGRTTNPWTKLLMITLPDRGRSPRRHHSQLSEERHLKVIKSRHKKLKSASLKTG